MRIEGVIETCIYASDLNAAERFYGQILKLEQVSKEQNRHLFYKCGDGMLLIFNPEHTASEQTFVNGNPVPLHGSTGPGHLALAVESQDIPKWKERLNKWNINIESEITWPNGFNSIYFRDPAGNSIELVASGFWE
jgi:catechol 2,3-dioxygenase-like lactoylglutathione lyase family enzyme